ncbi:hypothetical protein [Agaribacterium sp. ZY112]|uniref:hypothetical protein n=1 Tax=Agaribacterium sp. ZY112 TaxID=3233574 RepID=UPI003525CEA4
MDALFSFVVLVLLIAVIWLLIDESLRQRLYRLARNKVSPKLANQYQLAFQDIFKDKHDQSVETLLEALEPSTQSLDLYLNLASLLREKGEFAQSLRIHEQLCSSAQLSEFESQRVHLELACDYWSAGLLGRAESELNALLERGKLTSAIRQQALSALLDIKQDFSEWLAAIDIADQLTAAKFAQEPDRWRLMQAQFCCELALEAQAAKDWPLMRQRLSDALRYDPECARARFIEVFQHIDEADTRSAIIALDDAVKRRPELAVLSLDLYVQCLHDPEAFNQKLMSLVEAKLSVSLLLEATHLLQKQGGSDAQLVRLWQHAVVELNALTAWRPILELALDEHRLELNHLVSASMQALKSDAYWLCENCGHKTQEHHWRCTTCRHWDSLKPSC